MGTTSRMLPAVTAIAVMLLVTSCHSPNTGQSASPPTAPGGTGASSGRSPSGAAVASASPRSGHGPDAEALTTCKTAALAVTVDGGRAGGATGSTYYPVDFVNTSGTPCMLDGYPGVSFVTVPGTAGRQIGAAAQRNAEFGLTVVRLAPGGYAHAWLQVAQAGNYPESSCHLVTALGLRVYPPGESRPGYVRRDFPACANASASLLTVMPLQPGKAIQGTTP